MQIELKHKPLGAEIRKSKTYTLEIPEDFKELIEALVEVFTNRFSLELPSTDGKKITIQGTYVVMKD